ncbi:YeeE/YedE family protein [Salinibius halmophilus]|uniref:YeeE/YedE family protein n=1 Tax=Salinibius halmophilus TaxID=1853216 RepID=UPI000E665F78|nr:YeeE/YedE thiosulfate transporter family protein [Salinibius halmophilus]
MTDFLPALLGGLLLGTASVLLFLLNGRIAGISGIFGGVVTLASQWGWRALFLVGLVAGGLVYQLAGGNVNIEQVASPLGLVIAGLLVGVGTTIGSGCTSGHGICGNSRFSPRSIFSTVTFMAAGIAIVAILRLVTGV